jgi:cytidylate kinase
MRTPANRGRVILLGRGGACLTHGFPGGVHIRLTAPKPVRVQRMRALLNLSEKEALRMMEERDRSRAALVRRYFDKDINDPLLYDAVWNTEEVSIDAIAQTVLRWVEYKHRPYETALEEIFL